LERITFCFYGFGDRQSRRIRNERGHRAGNRRLGSDVAQQISLDHDRAGLTLNLAQGKIQNRGQRDN
jgi:hypothetical protein